MIKLECHNTSFFGVDYINVDEVRIEVNNEQNEQETAYLCPGKIKFV